MFFVCQLYLQHILASWHSERGECISRWFEDWICDTIALSHGHSTFCYWWLSWKNAAESFTIALTHMDLCGHLLMMFCLFVPASSILCLMTGATTITGWMYRISDTNFEQYLKALKTIKRSHVAKAVVTYLSVWTNVLFFFSKFLATHKKLKLEKLSVKLELEITLHLRLSKGPFFLNFWCYFYISGNSGNFKESSKVFFI